MWDTQFRRAGKVHTEAPGRSMHLECRQGSYICCLITSLCVWFSFSVLYELFVFYFFPFSSGMKALPDEMRREEWL